MKRREEPEQRRRGGARGAYRALLWLLPREFRVRFGEDMVEVFAARLAEAATLRARALVWLRGAGDLLLQGLAERRNVRRLRRRDEGHGPIRDVVPVERSRTASGSRMTAVGIERGWWSVEQVAKDIRLGARSLRRAAAPTTVAVITLALGVGATTTIFSVVKGVLLDPLPYPESDMLVSVWGRFLPESGFDFPQFTLSPPEYFDYRAENRMMEDVAAVTGWGATLVGDDGEAIRVRGSAVTSNLFDVLGVRPAHGRGFTAEEAVPHGPAVVVLSHALWRSAFGGDPSILGREIAVSGSPSVVVGVMPEGFSFPSGDQLIWRPLDLDPAIRSTRQSHFLRVVARLRSGSTFESATSEMRTLMARWEAQYPEIHTGHFLWLNPLLDDVIGNVRMALYILLGVVGVVLVMVCANVANLLLARGVARRQEMAVRMALGGARSRLFRQLLTEYGLLALLGGAGGLLLAVGGVGAILRVASGAIPRADNVSVDSVMLLFTMTVAMAATLAAGTVPALRASRANPLRALREGGRTGTEAQTGVRFRSILVILEVALAVLIVAAAGLMARSFRTLVSEDPGIRADGILIADLTLPGSYANEGVVPFTDALLERMAGLPGVQSAAISSAVPLFETPGNYDFEVEGRASPGPGEPMTSALYAVGSPGLTETLGIPMVEGRWFDHTDIEGSLLVTVVSRGAARAFWPGESPIGRRIRMASSEGERPWLTIVGVVDDVKFGSLDGAIQPAYYTPHSQAVSSLGIPVRGLTFVLRTAGDPAALAPAVRAVVRDLDAGLPVAAMMTGRQLLWNAVSGPRFTMTLLGLFATLALSLGAIGLYGVLAYAVTERRREIGIRMALGAGRASVIALVAGKGLSLALTGLALGVPGALAASRIMRGLLFETSPTDPATHASVAMTMLVVAAVASIVPVVRAVRMDPARVLNTES
ncbi:MAG: ABC transporter permease [Gemmatimonadetes bacterium]|nr:ABC transporter permease [Gemmatimonadota bacterium]